MNTDTGEIYRNATEILAAKARGERVVPISEKAADRIEAGYACMNRAERRRRERENRRANKVK